MLRFMRTHRARPTPTTAQQAMMDIAATAAAPPVAGSEAAAVAAAARCRIGARAGRQSIAELSLRSGPGPRRRSTARRSLLRHRRCLKAAPGRVGQQTCDCSGIQNARILASG